MHKKLFIPGPTEVMPEILKAMSTPMIGHRTKDCSNLQRSICEKLRKVMFTKNTILLSTSSGTGLMEGSIRSLTAKKAIVFSVGAFGDRWYKIAKANNVPADLHKVELGKAITPEMVEPYLASGKYDTMAITHNETSTGVMNPLPEIAQVVKKYPDVLLLVDAVSSLGGVKLEVDKLGIDVCLTSSQKGFALPPGLSFCSISDRAIERGRKVSNRGYYLDLIAIYDYHIKKDHQYPSTPSLPHMFALDLQLDRILKEGIQARFDRHKAMAEYVRAWAKEHFALFADEKYASLTLTTVTNTRGISVADLNQELGKRGLMISNGYGELKEKTFRIAHMGDLTLEDVKELLHEINDILGLEEKAAAR